MADLATKPAVDDQGLYHRPRKRFTSEEFLRALRLITEKRPDGTLPSDREVARIMGSKARTIAKIRRAYADTSEEAMAILKASAAGAAKNWIKAEKIAATDGNHVPAKDHLIAAGAITDKSPTGGSTTVIMIGVGQTAVGPDPWAGVKVAGAATIDVPKTP